MEVDQINKGGLGKILGKKESYSERFPQEASNDQSKLVKGTSRIEELPNLDFSSNAGKKV